METLIMHPKSEDQVLALKAIAKAWKISIAVSPYDPAFVAMVKKQKKEGIIKMSILIMYGIV